MDEKVGRAAAEHPGLRVTGLVGVLIEARRCGLLADPAALAEQMRDHGFWIAERLIALLREA